MKIGLALDTFVALLNRCVMFLTMRISTLCTMDRKVLRSTVYHGSPLWGSWEAVSGGQVKQCNNKRYKIQFNKVYKVNY
jgi:hypothetical protein